MEASLGFWKSRRIRVHPRTSAVLFLILFNQPFINSFGGAAVGSGVAELGADLLESGDEICALFIVAQDIL